MQPSAVHISERFAALASIALGIAISVALAPNDSSFLSNLLFYWVPQACVLALFSLYKPPRPAVFAGIALALATYLALFGTWLFSRRHPESLTWLGYLLSLPGAVVGSFAAINWLGRNNALRPSVIAAATAIAALLGIAMNQVVVCSTVMYCMGK
jgi:hypothetical protein